MFLDKISLSSGKTQNAKRHPHPLVSLRLRQTSSKSGRDKWLQIMLCCSEGRSAQPHSKGRLSNAADWHVLSSDLSRSHGISHKNGGIKQTPPSLTFGMQPRRGASLCPSSVIPSKLQLPLGVVHSGFRGKELVFHFPRLVTPHLNEHLKEMNVPGTERFI